MSDPTTTSPLSRRRLFAGAGTAAALAGVAAVLPGVPAAPAAAPATPAAPQVDNGGYRLSEHVQRYYQTARV